MNTYITLFKSVNVSGKNTMSMKELVGSLEAAGFAQVRTYIQSGNVVYQASKARRTEIEKAVETCFGFKPDLLTFTTKNLEAALTKNPYKNYEGKTVHFFFFFDSPTKEAVENLLALKAETEEVQIIDKVLYLHAPSGIGRSKLVAKIDKTLGIKTTARNLNTMNKVLALVQK